MVLGTRRIAVVAVACALVLGVLGTSACAPTPGSSSAEGPDAAKVADSPQADAADANASAPGAADAANAGEAVAVQWAPDADCAVCHAVEGASMTDSATAASMHPASGCVDCHDDEATLSATHEGKTTADLAPKRLKKTAVAEQTCEACHSRDDIKSRAAQSTVLTDVNGTTVNPHDLPVHDSHSEIVCSDCHKVHADASELAEDAQQLCQSCHHSGVYECYTCHEHD